MSLKIRCEHDGNVFTAIPKPYPNEKMQTRVFCADGDSQIVCPRCKRSYVYHDSCESWLPGRPLTLLEVAS